MSILIGIDAGHGHNVPGKRCDKRFDPNQTREWDLNSRVATKIQQLLANLNVPTIRLDDVSGASDVALSTRTTKANKNNCALVVSIHHNAGGGEGLESYYQKTLPTTSRTYQICSTIHNAAIASTGQRNRGLKPSSSSAVGDLAILRDTKMPSIIVEGGFMDNVVDTPRILSDNFAQKLAQGVVNGIVKSFNISTVPIDNVPQPSGIYYPAVNNISIVDALKSINVDSSFANRKKIATANGISGYTGTYDQNIKLLDLMKKGKLKRV